MGRPINSSVRSPFKHQAQAPAAESINLGFKASNPHHRVAVEELGLDQLKIDPDIQRVEDPIEVARIGANFNPDALGTITVSARTNGKANGYDYFVVDGQQRTAGARLANYEEPILAVVHYGLTRDEEARLFLDLNYRRAVSAWAQFKARRVAGEAQALDIYRMIKDLDIPTGSPHGFTAIATADKIYRQKDGAVRLLWALRMTKVVYDGQGQGGCYDGRVIEAFAILFAHYGSKIDEKNLVARLQSTGGGTAALIGYGKTIQKVTGGLVAQAIANAMLNEYNRFKRSHAVNATRLPQITSRKNSKAGTELLASAGAELGTDD